MIPTVFIPLPLTKTLDPADWAALSPFTQCFPDDLLAGQHPLRQWEYCMALEAWNTWMLLETSRRTSSGIGWRTLDVGGAGSPFSGVLEQITHGRVSCAIIDPHLNTPIEAAAIPPASIDAVFSISTIEHVPDPLGFLQAITDVLVPGGLLFLTTDCWNGTGPDTAHFHWMRERIYTLATWRALAHTVARAYGLQLLGEADWAYHGDFLYGSYTFASMALIKGVLV